MFGFQQEIVLNLASDRAGCHVNRGVIRCAGFDVSAMAGKIIFAAVAEIAFIVDLAAGRVDLYLRAAYPIQRDIAAHRGDLHVPIANIGKRDRAIQGLNVDVCIADIAHINIRLAAFQDHIAVQSLGLQRTGTRSQSDAGVGGNRYFIVNASRVGGCLEEQMGDDVYPVSVLALVNFRPIGMQDCGLPKPGLPEPGFTEIGPYWLVTEIAALGPTVKWNSFRTSAEAQIVVARIATVTSCAARCALSILVPLLKSRITADLRSPNPFPTLTEQ